MRFSVLAFMLILSGNVWSVDLSMDNLAGEWEFLHWAEADAPEKVNPVGIVMDFRADGTVASMVGGKPVLESSKWRG